MKCQEQKRANPMESPAFRSFHKYLLNIDYVPGPVVCGEKPTNYFCVLTLFWGQPLRDSYLVLSHPTQRTGVLIKRRQRWTPHKSTWVLHVRVPLPPWPHTIQDDGQKIYESSDAFQSLI